MHLQDAGLLSGLRPTGLKNVFRFVNVVLPLAGMSNALHTLGWSSDCFSGEEEEGTCEGEIDCSDWKWVVLPFAACLATTGRCFGKGRAPQLPFINQK